MMLTAPWVSSHPQERLADRVVTDYFLVLGIWIQRFPEIDVFPLVTGDAGEQQAGRAHRQSIKVLNVFCPLPRTLALKVRIDEIGGQAKPASVRKLEGRRIRRGSFERLAESRHYIEVEDRITVRLGARQFPRKSSIRSDLI